MATKVVREEIRLRASVRECSLPFLGDAVVLGREAPIGCTAMLKIAELISTARVEHIEPDDPVVGDILARRSLLRRVPRERLIAFVLEHIKPRMGPDDILDLSLSAVVDLEIEGA